MNVKDALLRVSDLLDVATSALDAIAKLTKNTTDDKAIEVLKAVSAMAATARAGLKGDVSPSEVRAALSDLQDNVSKINTKIDRMIHDKFDTNE